MSVKSSFVPFLSVLTAYRYDDSVWTYSKTSPFTIIIDISA